MGGYDNLIAFPGVSQPVATILFLAATLAFACVWGAFDPFWYQSAIIIALCIFVAALIAAVWAPAKPLVSASVNAVGCGWATYSILFAFTGRIYCFNRSCGWKGRGGTLDRCQKCGGDTSHYRQHYKIH